jgi:hypothetical protein
MHVRACVRAHKVVCFGIDSTNTCLSRRPHSHRRCFMYAHGIIIIRRRVEIVIWLHSLSRVLLLLLLLPLLLSDNL